MPAVQDRGSTGKGLGQVKTGNRILLICSTLGVLVMLALGTWQVQRLQWKNSLIEKRQQAIGSNPISLTDIEAGIEHGFDVDWFKVSASGMFAHDHERHVYALRNGKIGWRIITPFAVSGQYVVLVDRGFVPDDKKARASRPESWMRSCPTYDCYKIVGYVRTDAGAAGPFTPKNDPASNRWYSIDLMEMVASLPEKMGFVAPDGYAITLPVIVQLAPEDNPTAGVLPIVDPVDVNLRNSHLQYAITWYALALVLIVISILFHRSRQSGKEPTT